MSRSKSATSAAIAFRPARTARFACAGRKSPKGYWRDPDKTAAAFFGDWFRTGDVGHLDAEGFLYLTDRKKDMIISGGENIASSEVERVIYELPVVRECAVVGLADERWGEKPVAVVVLADNTFARSCHSLRRIAGHDWPDSRCRRNSWIRDSLPRNPSGKVLKRVLRSRTGDAMKL